MQRETKKRIWCFSRGWRFRWFPEIYNNAPDRWECFWLGFCLEWVSKEYLAYCEEHGWGVGDFVQMMAQELLNELPFPKDKTNA